MVFNEKKTENPLIDGLLLYICNFIQVSTYANVTIFKRTDNQDQGQIVLRWEA